MTSSRRDARPAVAPHPDAILAVVARTVRSRPGNLRLIGAVTCLLLLSLLVGSTSAHHRHRGPGEALYDDACLDLRLAMNSDHAGLGPPSPIEFGLLPRSDSLGVASTSGNPDVRPPPTVARAPPHPA